MNFINNPNIHIDFNAKVPYITFPVLSEIPFIKHGFSTRLGGLSTGIFSSMNLAFSASGNCDDPDKVMENYRLICEAMGIYPSTLVISQQEHKTSIRVVDEKDRGKGLFKPRDYKEIDGLVTNKPGVTLVTKYADCVPLFLVDTKNRAIGLSHAGWRGTAGKIGLKTVETMNGQYNSDPADIIAVIGPSICRDCYEIGEETAEEFENAFRLTGDNNILHRDNEGRIFCDLWEANRTVLLEAGLLPENIHISGVCTCCNDDLLFSHRRSRGRRGSLAAFLMIKE
jgi:YfiH family protein